MGPVGERNPIKTGEDLLEEVGVRKRVERLSLESRTGRVWRDMAVLYIQDGRKGRGTGPGEGFSELRQNDSGVDYWFRTFCVGVGGKDYWSTCGSGTRRDWDGGQIQGEGSRVRRFVQFQYTILHFTTRIHLRLICLNLININLNHLMLNLSFIEKTKREKYPVRYISPRCLFVFTNQELRTEL